MSSFTQATAANFLPCVHIFRRDHIAVVEISNPPVNALSSVVKQALADAIDGAVNSPEIAAIVLTGAGKHFCGGADIREFGQVTGPSLSGLCTQIENSTKPVIAAIKGSCLGGGLELALAAHFRIAVATAQLGLPEVNLGLMPGAGGTQRLPRLVGAAQAIDMMVSGRSVKASVAVQTGLIDRVCSDDVLQDAAVQFATEIIQSGQCVRRSRDALAMSDAGQSQAEIDQAKDIALAKKGLVSPAKIVEAVQASLELSFEEGLIKERELFSECLESPQRSALIHAFLAEKAASKVPGLSVVSPTPLRTIAVIGAGTMGVGISIALLDAGYAVLLLEREQAYLERGLSAITESYRKQQERNRISAEVRAERVARLACHIDYAALHEADLIIEAVFEDMAVKKKLLCQLEKACKPDAILATNTSYLNIDEMSEGLDHPERVIGIHFFSPANLMKLVEVVVPEKADQRTVAIAFELAKSMKKTPVRAGMCDGFIGNRMLAVYREAAELMMLDGASPYQIDEAVREFGFPMGPFQVVDLAGGDISWATRKRKASQRDPRLRYVSVADKLCERGWFGQKTGIGYYLYDQGGKNAQPNPELEDVLSEVRSQAGIVPKHFTQQTIIDHYLAAMINEGANVVHQGIALRPSDVDVTLLNGYGFPRYKGGPMWYADSVGLERVLANIARYAETDPLFWKPSDLLVELATQGRSFSDLNR